jgi:beta-galactosidase
LRKVFGIWNEEIDGITPDDIQQVVSVEDNNLGLHGAFKAYDYCERIHLEGAEALAVYGKDFYAGEPAVTVNKYGKGRAYYIAARTDDEFLMAFTSAVITAGAINKILPVALPDGVTAQRRMDGEKEFIFILNFLDKERTVDLGDETFIDMISGEDVKGSITLAANGSTVLEKTGNIT